MRRNTKVQAQSKKKNRILSEYESKQFVSSYGIQVSKEMLISDRKALAKIRQRIGFPVVMKGLKPGVVHKSEHNLVQPDIRSEQEALLAYDELLSAMNDEQAAVLASEMLPAQREVMLGLIRDEQFGPCVLFGLGGLLTEILNDVTFRIAPCSKKEAMAMLTEIKGKSILGPVRGMPAVDKDILSDMLITLGNIGNTHDSIHSIDLNPVLFNGPRPVAVDALVVFDALDA